MKMLSIVGARPQFVKAAMVTAAVERLNKSLPAERKLRHRLVHTGQHYDFELSGIFFRQLPLPKPHYYLEVGSGTHGQQTGAMLERTEGVLLKERPDLVMVYGDTNSTLAGALAACKLHCAVAHVEAGLRSFNRDMPEEINRVATDHLSNLLFCPTPTSVANLDREGIKRGVCWSGDVMLDAVLAFRAMAASRYRGLKKLGVKAGSYALLTLHRAENTDCRENLLELLEIVLQMKYPVVFPMHPRLRDRLARGREGRSLRRSLTTAAHVKITRPVSYLDMLLLEENARLVLTDSGGVQKEAYFLGVPCVTLRSETEWVETLQGGWNHLMGTRSKEILGLVDSLWGRNGALPTGDRNLRLFGGGGAADRIVNWAISGEGVNKNQ